MATKLANHFELLNVDAESDDMSFIVPDFDDLKSSKANSKRSGSDSGSVSSSKNGKANKGQGNGHQGVHIVDGWYGNYKRNNSYQKSNGAYKHGNGQNNGFRSSSENRRYLNSSEQNYSGPINNYRNQGFAGEAQSDENHGGMLESPVANGKQVANGDNNHSSGSERNAESGKLSFWERFYQMEPEKLEEFLEQKRQSSNFWENVARLAPKDRKEYIAQKRKEWEQKRIEREAEEKIITLATYEETLAEKRKKIPELMNGEREVTVDKEFELMQPIGKKKELASNLKQSEQDNKKTKDQYADNEGKKDGKSRRDKQRNPGVAVDLKDVKPSSVDKPRRENGQYPVRAPDVKPSSDVQFGRENGRYQGRAYEDRQHPQGSARGNSVDNGRYQGCAYGNRQFPRKAGRGYTVDNGQYQGRPNDDNRQYQREGNRGYPANGENRNQSTYEKYRVEAKRYPGHAVGVVDAALGTGDQEKRFEEEFPVLHRS